MFCGPQGTIANSLTCVQLHKRAEKIAVMLMERGHLQDGDHVALVYPPGEDQDHSSREALIPLRCWRVGLWLPPNADTLCPLPQV